MRTHTARTWREYRDGLICLMTGVTREMENPHAMRDNKKKKTLRSTDTCFNKKYKSPPSGAKRPNKYALFHRCSYANSSRIKSRGRKLKVPAPNHYAKMRLLLHLVGSGLLRLANTFAESNRASSSPQGLKILGDPMNDTRSLRVALPLSPNTPQGCRGRRWRQRRLCRGSHSPARG